MKKLYLEGLIEKDLQDAVVVMGKFNALHIGHNKLITEGRKEATKLGKPLCVLTFNPGPDEFFSEGYAENEKAIMLANFEQRSKLFEKMDVDAVVFIKFDLPFSKLSPEEFVKDYLADKMKISHLLTGDDFRFAHKRMGTVQDMKDLSGKYGFEYSALEQVLDEEKAERSSSTTIRTLLLTGNVKKAGKLLGRKFAIAGTVQEGHKLAGPVLGYPTANIDTGSYAPMKNGAYYCLVEIDGAIHDAACNYGVKPTLETNETKPLLEVHILNYNGNLYGKEISVEFCEFIREEMKFEDPNKFDKLRAQIEKDIEWVNKYKESMTKEKYTGTTTKLEGVLER